MSMGNKHMGIYYQTEGSGGSSSQTQKGEVEPKKQIETLTSSIKGILDGTYVIVDASKSKEFFSDKKKSKKYENEGFTVGQGRAQYVLDNIKSVGLGKDEIINVKTACNHILEGKASDKDYVLAHLANVLVDVVTGDLTGDKKGRYTEATSAVKPKETEEKKITKEAEKIEKKEDKKVTPKKKQLAEVLDDINSYYQNILKFKQGILPLGSDEETRSVREALNSALGKILVDVEKRYEAIKKSGLDSRLEDALALRDELEVLSTAFVEGGSMAYNFALYLYSGDSSKIVESAASEVVSGAAGVQGSFFSVKNNQYTAHSGATEEGGEQYKKYANSFFRILADAYVQWMMPEAKSALQGKYKNVEDAAEFLKNMQGMFTDFQNVLKSDSSDYKGKVGTFLERYKTFFSEDANYVLLKNFVDVTTLSKAIGDSAYSEAELFGKLHLWLGSKEKSGDIEEWRRTKHSLLAEYGNAMKDSGAWEYSSLTEINSALAPMSEEARKKAEASLAGLKNEILSVEAFFNSLSVTDLFFLNRTVDTLKDKGLYNERTAAALIRASMLVMGTDKYIFPSFLENAVSVIATADSTDSFVNIITALSLLVYSNSYNVSASMHIKRKWLLGKFEDMDTIPEKVSIYNTLSLEKDLRESSPANYRGLNAFTLKFAESVGTEKFFSIYYPTIVNMGLLKTYPVPPVDPFSAQFNYPFLSNAAAITSGLESKFKLKPPSLLAGLPEYTHLRRWTDAGFISELGRLFADFPVAYAGFEPLSAGGAVGGYFGYHPKTYKLDGIEQLYLSTLTGGISVAAKQQATWSEETSTELYSAQEGWHGMETALGNIHNESGSFYLTKTKSGEGVYDRFLNYNVSHFQDIAKKQGHNILVYADGYDNSSSSKTPYDTESGLKTEKSEFVHKGGLYYIDKLGNAVRIELAGAGLPVESYFVENVIDKDTNEVKETLEYKIHKDKDGSFYYEKDGQKIAVSENVAAGLGAFTSKDANKLWDIMRNYIYGRAYLPGVVGGAAFLTEAKAMPAWGGNYDLNGLVVGFDIGDFSLYSIYGKRLGWDGKKWTDEAGLAMALRNIFQQQDALALLYRGIVPTPIETKDGKLKMPNYANLEAKYIKLSPQEKDWSYLARLMVGSAHPEWEWTPTPFVSKAQTKLAGEIKAEKKGAKLGASFAYENVPLWSLLGPTIQQADQIAASMKNILVNGYGYTADEAEKTGLFLGFTYLQSKLSYAVAGDVQNGNLTQEEAKDWQRFFSVMLIAKYYKNKFLLGVEKVPWFLDAMQQVDWAMKSVLANPTGGEAVLQNAVKSISNLMKQHKWQAVIGYGYDDRAYLLGATDFKSMAGMRGIVLISEDGKWAFETITQINPAWGAAVIQNLNSLVFPLPGDKWFSAGRAGAGPVLTTSIPFKKDELEMTGYTWEGLVKVLEQSEGWNIIAGAMGGVNTLNDYKFKEVGVGSTGRTKLKEIQGIISAYDIEQVSAGEYERYDVYLLVDKKTKTIYKVTEEMYDNAGGNSSAIAKEIGKAEGEKIYDALLFTLGFEWNKTSQSALGVTGKGLSLVLTAGPATFKTAEKESKTLYNNLQFAGGIGYNIFKPWGKLTFSAAGGVGPYPNYFSFWDPTGSTSAFTVLTPPVVSDTVPWWIALGITFWFGGSSAQGNTLENK